MALPPVPPQPPLLLTPTIFQQKYQERFADNDFFDIEEADLREQARDVASLLLLWSKLGQPLLLSTLDELATVDQRITVVGQSALVANATDAGSAATGVDAGEAEFILRKDSTGPLWAYSSVKSSARVRVRWLPVGDPSERPEFLPYLQLEDYPVKAGDAFKFEFEDGQTIPLQARRDLPLPGAGIMNPVPTGAADDPNYLPLAPLVSALPGAGVTAESVAGVFDKDDGEFYLQVLNGKLLPTIRNSAVVLDKLGNDVLERLSAAAPLLQVLNGTTKASRGRFSSVASALAAFQTGDILLGAGYLPGLAITKSGTYLLNAAYVGGEVSIGAFPNFQLPLTVRLFGLTFSNRLVIISQSQGGHTIELNGIHGLAGGYIEHYALQATASSADRIHVLNADLLCTNSPSSISGGTFVFQGRTDANSNYPLLVVENSRVVSRNGPILSGYVHPSARITWRGSTTLQAAGNVVSTLYRLPQSTAYADADLLVDESSTGGAGPGGITAAQLEMVRSQATLSSRKTANYTLQLADAGNIVPFVAAAVCTIPPDVFAVGTVLEIAQDGTGTVTVAAGAGVAIRTATGLKTGGQWASVGLRQRDVNEWVLTNGIA
ncbi:hypothetical protein [Hymenobacter canadensis]|uniref:Tail fiber protein n=1 Tax=Hymenobacter canadensis TaxID=2999067 RepID=A0ABY7LU78_9BACT|nr:hypothetical protein [Hymenobacter canadensis]WBA42967.1 hypothetical protein O3303_05235 [Hymenobacter canadensis]